MDKDILQRLSDEGFSTRQMAEQLSVSQTTIRYYLTKYGIPTRYRQVQREFADKTLIKAVKTSLTKASVLRKLGLSIRPGNYETLNRYVNRLGLDISHFKGKGHGTTFRIKWTDREVFSKDSSYSRTNLKKRIIKNNLLNWKVCSICGVKDVWKGKRLVMILDHINGINNDNRLKNLRFVCPNCNSQLDTFCKSSS
jgi:hypothetical protein